MFWSTTQRLLLHGIVTAADVHPIAIGGLDAAGDLVRSDSLSRAIDRRQRLSGAGLSPRPGRHPGPISIPSAVKRSDRVKGFVVQPRRWVVETAPNAWLNRCRRLAKDWENRNVATRSP